MSNKIKVWNTNSSAKPNNAIKVFEYGSTATKPNDAILVTSADNGPANAIKVNVVNDYAVDAIPVWYAGGGETPFPYETVKIGDNVWMAENLRYDDGGEGIYHSACVVNGVDFGEQYYYSKEAVERIHYTISSVYPGWHLSYLSDVELLKNEVDNDSNQLRTVSGWIAGWEGNDLKGFHGEPVGEGSTDGGFHPRNDNDNGAVGRGCRYALGLNNYWGLNGRPGSQTVASGNWRSVYSLYPIRLVKDNL